jgi:hypothetical protein
VNLRPTDFISTAIRNLAPTAQFAIRGGVIEWHTPDPPTPAAIDAEVARLKVDLAREQQIKRFADEAQARLDTWAQSRGYDGILSACTYATSQVPRFRADGQRCVNLRDQTWARLYEILAEVEAGVRPVPLSLAEIEVDLPALTWEGA